MNKTVSIVVWDWSVEPVFDIGKSAAGSGVCTNCMSSFSTKGQLAFRWNKGSTGLQVQIVQEKLSWFVFVMYFSNINADSIGRVNNIMKFL